MSQTGATTSKTVFVVYSRQMADSRPVGADPAAKIIANHTIRNATKTTAARHKPAQSIHTRLCQGDSRCALFGTKETNPASSICGFLEPISLLLSTMRVRTVAKRQKTWAPRCRKTRPWHCLQLVRRISLLTFKFEPSQDSKNWEQCLIWGKFVAKRGVHFSR